MKLAYRLKRYSSRGVAAAAKALVAVVAIVALLITLAAVGFSGSSNASPTTTVVSTQTATVLDGFTKTITVAAGNDSGVTINPEQIYAKTNESIVTLQGVLTSGNGLGQPAESV